MHIRELHRRTVEGFAATAALVRADHWASPTPCSDWDVRALVNHVVGEDRWTVPLISGQTIADVGDALDGDLLGDHPATACAAAASAAVDAVAEPGALDRIVHLSYGDVQAPDYLWELFADHLIHGWDLAVAIGADTRLDPEMVEACAGWFALREPAWREAGAIGPRVEVAGGAGPQAELLAAFGRREDQPAPA